MGGHVMATVALHDSDGTTFPNLALMKLAAWHKANGDTVERFMPILHNAGQKNLTVYSSKVFSWTPEYAYLPAGAHKGGTALQDGLRRSSPLPGGQL